MKIGLIQTLFVTSTLAVLGCSDAASEPDADSTDEALGVTTSGFPECPGVSWTRSIRDWNGAVGTFARSGSARPGELAQLTILETASQANRMAPRYFRVAGSPDSGRVILGVDNPAIGPVMSFHDESLQRAKDAYWVLGQQRRFGSITAVCLAPASSSTKPFMIARVGF